MASVSGMLKVACVVIMCMVVTAPYAKAALSCGTVASNLTPCLNYLQNGGSVPANCCSGIRNLASAATTKPARQAVCKCLKSAAGSVHNVNLKNAAGLLGKCGINIPYKISNSTDCAKYLSSLFLSPCGAVRLYVDNEDTAARSST
ncbi:hypothetical protein RJ639_018064 [Escallonia herrerae]|uniref:Non-specific lipid-transfer protein n=1 Tax=Escallonia herrerae TaxID=1293975 RepID=A0AA89AKN8_9ASTE|nr:hypothetical protein RJ639_018064 [Escallonia herrerae]